MTLISPIKSSSRAGRFKKKLVSETKLHEQTPQILASLAPFQDLHASGGLNSAEFTACYVLVFLSHRFPGSWLGAKNNTPIIPGVRWKDLPFRFEENIIKRLSNTSGLMDLIGSFSFRSTPKSVNRAILEWAWGTYQLELMFRIPSPREVLNQQVRGRRCVTALVDEKISKYILGERDALSFTMHDLIHADHFYSNRECYQGQLGFYGLLNETFNYFDLSQEKFLAEFEYLISDMNAYAIHLLKCLKSAMEHHFDKKHFLDWVRDLAPPESILLLNTPAYVPEIMDSELLRWLDKFTECTEQNYSHSPGLQQN